MHYFLFYYNYQHQSHDFFFLHKICHLSMQCPLMKLYIWQGDCVKHTLFTVFTHHNSCCDNFAPVFHHIVTIFVLDKL